MKADTEERIFDFETNIESALQDLLQERGVLAHVHQGVQRLGDSYVAAMVRMGEAEEKFSTKPDGQPEFDVYRGVFEISVRTLRDSEEVNEKVVSKVKGLHSAWRSVIRKELQLCSSKPFDEENLPFYTVHWLRPTSTTFNTESPTMEDVSILTYEFVIQIRPDSWPETNGGE